VSAAPPSVAFCASVARDLVVVSGPDSGSFLQSLLSQDLGSLVPGEAVPALLLQPRGKLLVDLVVRRHGEEEWWCVCEAGFGGVLADGLRRFRIRVKVEIEERPVEALAVRGIGLSDRPGVARLPGVVAVPVRWGTVGGFDLIGDPGGVAAARAELGLPVAEADAYEAARIEVGVPRMGVDLDEDTIPQEAGLDRDAISFTKGCFIGQELVCRIDSRGHVNRHLRRLRGGSPTVGAAVTAAGREVGSVTSAAGEVALALVRREVEPGATVLVDGRESRVEVC